MAATTLQSESALAMAMDRLNTTLRAIRVLQSSPSSTLSGQDLEAVLAWKRRSIQHLEEIVADCLAILGDLRNDPDFGLPTATIQ